MSVAYGVSCLDCLLPSPSVGDGGFLGSPTLNEDSTSYGFLDCDPMDGFEIPTFGFLYEPMRSLGLQTFELERFRSFLNEHVGHRVYLSSDHDDPAKQPPQYVRSLDNPRYREAARHEGDAAREAEAAAIERGEFALAAYEIRCVSCLTSHRSDPAILRTFSGDQKITSAVAHRFLQHTDGFPDDGSNHRLLSIVDPFGPFMEGLRAFLNEHSKHVVKARLLSDANNADGPATHKSAKAVLHLYRSLTGSYLLLVLMNLGSRVMRRHWDAAALQEHLLPELISLTLLLAAASVCFHSFRLAQALRLRFSFLWAVGSLLPLIGTAATVILTRRSIGSLRMRGFEIDLFGRPKA